MRLRSPSRGLAPVAIYDTVQRARLDTVREDNVRETSYSIWFENQTGWNEWFRSVVGIRAETESLSQVVTNFLNFARPAQLTLSRVELDAVLAAYGAWQTVVLAAAALIWWSRSRLDRRRDSAWERDIRCLIHDNGGRTP